MLKIKTFLIMIVPTFLNGLFIELYINALMSYEKFDTRSAWPGHLSLFRQFPVLVQVSDIPLATT